METLLQIAVALVTLIVVVIAAVFFGIPEWVPGDRKPDKETMTVLGVIFGLIVFVIIGAILWENLIK